MTSSLNGMFGIRPIIWIASVVILTVTVALWRSLHRRPHGDESPSELSEIDSGWALVGILCTGFACGALFQLWSGDLIRSFVSYWLDEDGQIVVVLIISFVVVGSGFALLLHLPEIVSLIRVRLQRKKWG